MHAIIFLAYNWGLVKDGTSPRKVASDLRLPESQDSMAKKFKVAQKYLAQWTIKKIAVFQAGLMGGEGGSGRREDSNKEHSSFPGDKLPEHHFKKK